MKEDFQRIINSTLRKGISQLDYQTTAAAAAVLKICREN